MTQYGSIPEEHFNIEDANYNEPEQPTRNSSHSVLVRILAITGLILLFYVCFEKGRISSENEIMFSTTSRDQKSENEKTSNSASVNAVNDAKFAFRVNDIAPVDPQVFTRSPSVYSPFPRVYYEAKGPFEQNHNPGSASTTQSSQFATPVDPPVFTRSPSVYSPFPRVYDDAKQAVRVDPPQILKVSSNKDALPMDHLIKDSTTDEKSSHSSSSVYSASLDSGLTTTAQEESFKTTFRMFTKDFSKSYSTADEANFRYGIFKQNVKRIQELNEKERLEGTGVVHAVNQFADRTDEEFYSFAGGLLGMDDPQGGRPITKVAQADPSLTARNWAGTLTTPVKNQAGCGSCWAFSLSEQIESDAIRQGLPGFSTSTVLSPQQLVSCDVLDGQCNGGRLWWAAAWVGTNGGLVYESDYPYTSSDGSVSQCSYSKTNAVVTIAPIAGSSLGLGGLNAFSKGFASEADMKDYVLTTGPIIQGFLVPEGFNSYSSGVITTCVLPSPASGHAIQIVGVNLTDPNNQYWIIRNSWGVNWGQKGYFYMKYGVNLCGIGRYGAMYTIPQFISTHPPVAAPSPSPPPTPGPTGTDNLVWSWSGPSTFSKCQPNSYGLNCVPNNPIYSTFPKTISTAFTISLWVTPAAWTKEINDLSYLVSLGVNPWTTYNTLSIIMDNSTRFYVYDICNYRPVPSYAKLVPNVRTHIAVVRSGLSYTYYVNGVKDNAFSGISSGLCNGAYSSKYWALGSYLGGGDGNLNYLVNRPLADYNYQGVMDGVRVYSSSLNADQVRAIYLGAVPTFVPTKTPTTAPSAQPTEIPTFAPSSPTTTPSAYPSAPTISPTVQPSAPSVTPTTPTPTTSPSVVPTAYPSSPTLSPTGSNGRIFSTFTDATQVFNGYSTYFTYPKLPYPISSTYTVSLFIKTTVSGTYQPILSLGRPSTTGDFLFLLWDNGMIGFQDDCVGSGFYLSNTKFNTGTRQHLAFTRNGNKYCFYSNGKGDGCFILDSTCSYETGPLTVGQEKSTGLFQGEMDNLQLFNKALSSSDINTLFNTGTLSPTAAPSRPSAAPTSVPSSPTAFPSKVPASPSLTPSTTPSTQPTFSPSAVPTLIPSSVPSQAPSPYPISSPTSIPKSVPTPVPSAVPSLSPTTLNGRIFAAFLSAPQTFDGSRKDVFNPLPNQLTTTFTVSMFIRTSSTGSYQALVALNRPTGYSSVGDFMLMVWSDGRLSYQDDCVGGNWFYLSLNAVNTGARRHVALVKNGGSYCFYNNGNVDGCFTLSASCSFGTSNLILGGASDASNYVGQLDSVQIYNKALSSADISALALSGTLAPTAAPSSPTVAPTAVPSAPTFRPTSRPSFVPSAVPSSLPTSIPRSAPTPVPSAVPSLSPTTLNGRIFAAFLSAPQTFDGSRKDVFNPLPNQLTTTFTVSMFIRTSSTGSYQALVALNRPSGYSSVGDFMLMVWSDGRLSYQDDCVGGNWFYLSLNAVNTGARRHVALVKNGGSYCFYNNGNVDGCFTLSASCSFGTSNLILGGASDASNYVGQLDSVQIYNKALSSADISALASSG